MRRRAPTRLPHKAEIGNKILALTVRCTATWPTGTAAPCFPKPPKGTAKPLCVPYYLMGAPVWGYAAKTNINILDTLQNSTIRMIVKASRAAYESQFHLRHAPKRASFSALRHELRNRTTQEITQRLARPIAKHLHASRIQPTAVPLYYSDMGWRLFASHMPRYCHRSHRSHRSHTPFLSQLMRQLSFLQPVI
ncbi:hypothetical protein TNCV_3349061 [Trichonephila clavipes]|nr:hypothetical protein TNCV_3349061 [Trichonephila clavipes]